MSSEFFELPQSEEAEYLLAGLARLIQLRGVEPFVAAPLLLPDPRFFPDPVKVRKRKVAVLLQRLLAYAELSPKRVDIEIVDSPTAILYLIGRKLSAPWCSSCRHHVRRAATRCSFCSTRLVADIADPMERFEAEQRFRGQAADG
jgi:hypothetical protein